MIALLFILMNYNAKIFIKYPFKYERFSPDTTCENCCEYVEDSVVTNTKVKVKISRKIDKIIKEKDTTMLTHFHSGVEMVNFSLSELKCYCILHYLISFKIFCIIV